MTRDEILKAAALIGRDEGTKRRLDDLMVETVGSTFVTMELKHSDKTTNKWHTEFTPDEFAAFKAVVALILENRRTDVARELGGMNVG